MLKAKIETFNADVKTWGEGTKSNIESSAPVGNHLPNEKLPDNYQTIRESLRIGFRREKTPWGNRIFRIGFNFARHGVFVHYGAGRGYGGSQGSRWKDRSGKEKKTNPDSLGKMGSGNRRPKNWFNPGVKQRLDELDKVIEDYGDGLVVNSVRIMLPEN